MFQKINNKSCSEVKNLIIIIYYLKYMIAALGSLASYALPKLLTFASKKLFNTNIGSTVHKALRSKGM